MDLVKTEKLNQPFQGMVGLPLLRQIGLLIGLAASIAIGVSIVLWSRTPDYSILYDNVSGQGSHAIADVLQRSGIDYRMDPDSGMLMVDSSKINEAKLKLAAENLTPSDGHGFELIEKEQGFGSSSFLQSARYHRAQEGELARTIMSIAAVKSARVHLALPKESAFIRKRRKASASVMLKLVPGRRLEKQQIAAITNLIASSVPNMETKQITVVDDKGRLLSSGDNGRDMVLTASQFEYTKEVEQTYVERVENILSPLVGLNGVRAQVTADIDFTRTESTQEMFNPDLPAVRSEQSFEEQTQGGVSESGVPGALSNEPPGQVTAPEVATAEAGTTAVTQNPSKTRRRSTRNFELDKTISHTQRSPGAIRRLSIAVVLDVKQIKNDKGEGVKTPYTPEELQRFTTLVKEAVGFNSLRGDSVNIINAEFTVPEVIEDIPEESFWEKPWFWSTLKQAAGVVLLLLLLFGVLRPVMHGLATRPRIHYTETGEAIPEDQLTLSGGTGRLPRETTYEDNLNIAKSLATQEPKRVAQVVKSWLEEPAK